MLRGPKKKNILGVLGLKNILKKTFQTSLVTKNLLTYNNINKTIKLIKNVNNYEKLNTREAYEKMFKNKNNLINWN